jgi:hypothetical protein
MKEGSDSAPPRFCKKRKRISLLAKCTVMATPASAYERTIGHERNMCQMDCQSH